MLKVVWRGQPVFVVRRTKAVIAAIANHNDMLADPNSDDSVQPELHQGLGPGARPQSRILGGIGGVHPSRLLAARRVRAQ